MEWFAATRNRVSQIEQKLIDAARETLKGASDDELRTLKSATKYLTFSEELRTLITEEIARRAEERDDDPGSEARAARHGDLGIRPSDFARLEEDDDWTALDDQTDGVK